MVLDGLDAIPWAELKHAYGTAEDVPKLLCSLASDDSAVREDAWGELYGNIWHQGTIYQATAYAVPFLIKLLEDPKVPKKDRILSYLGDLATGTSYYDVHQREGRDKPEMARKIEEELDWVRATREAVYQGLPVYLGFLHDNEPAARACVVHLLGIFPERAESLAELHAHFAREEDEMVCTACVLAIGEFSDPQVTGWLLKQVHSEELAVRVAAACKLAERQREKLDDAAKAVLLDTLRDQEEAEEVFEQFPWDQEAVETLCTDALIASIGMRETLQAVLRMMEDEPSASERLTWLLMGIAGNGPIILRGGTALTDDQRFMLQALIDSPTFWQGKAPGVLPKFGYPKTREGLQALLEGRTIPEEPEKKKPWWKIW